MADSMVVLGRAAPQERRHDHAPGFVARWFLSTNHKDIGTLYIVFSLFTAFVSVASSMLMRLELAQPGLQFFADGQAWNAWVSTHGLTMIFFVVMPVLIGGFGNWFVLIMSGRRTWPSRA